jgi:hypothetical protein
MPLCTGTACCACSKLQLQSTGSRWRARTVLSAARPLGQTPRRTPCHQLHKYAKLAQAACNWLHTTSLSWWLGCVTIPWVQQSSFSEDCTFANACNSCTLPINQQKLLRTPCATYLLSHPACFNAAVANRCGAACRASILQAPKPLVRVQVACLSRAGREPGYKKTNQDNCFAYEKYITEGQALFGAMDGHGPNGAHQVVRMPCTADRKGGRAVCVRAPNCEGPFTSSQLRGSLSSLS